MGLIDNKLLKTSSIYVIANLINAVVPFILLPYLTDHLTPNSYALISLISVAISFFGPFVGFSVNNALLRRYYNDKEYNFKTYLSNCFYILLITIICFTTIILTIGDTISSIFIIPTETLKYILMISGTSFIHQLLLTTWRVTEKPIKYALFQIFLTVSNLIITIYLISYFDLDWEGRILGWVISNSFLALISIIYLWSNGYLFKKITKKYILDAIQFSIPLIPHVIGALLFGVFSRLIVGKVLSVKEVGIFSVSYQFASILGVVFAAFNTAFVPWLFNKLKSENVNNKYLVNTSYKLMGIFVLTTIIGYVSIQIAFPYIVNEKFAEAKNNIFFLLLSFMCNGLYYLVANYIFYKEKNKYLAYSTGAIGLIHIPICFFLTKYFGLYGTSLANFISYFLLFLLTWKISNSVYPMPWFGLKINKTKN